MWGLCTFAKKMNIKNLSFKYIFNAEFMFSEMNSIKNKMYLGFIIKKMITKHLQKCFGIVLCYKHYDAIYKM